MNEALVLLLLLWAVLLIPGALRSRRSSPHATVGGFSRAMDVLRARPDTGRDGQGRQVMVPVDASRIVERDQALHAVRHDAAGPGDAGGSVPETNGDAAARSASEPVGTARGTARGATPAGEDPLVARRRAWFLRLVVGSAVTLVLAVAVGNWMWLAFVVVAAVTAGYTALLRHLKLQHDQARRVVRDLDLPARSAAHASGTRERVDATASGEVAVGSTVRLRRWDG